MPPIGAAWRSLSMIAAVVQNGYSARGREQTSLG